MLYVGGAGAGVPADRSGALHPVPGQAVPHPTTADSFPGAASQVTY